MHMQQNRKSRGARRILCALLLCLITAIQPAGRAAVVVGCWEDDVQIGKTEAYRERNWPHLYNCMTGCVVECRRAYNPQWHRPLSNAAFILCVKCAQAEC